MSADSVHMTGPCKDCGKEISLNVPGVFAGHGFPGVRCDDCARTFDADELERETQDIEAAHLRAVQRRRAASGIPPHLQGFTFEDVVDDEALIPAVKAAKDWASGSINGLIIGGPVGVGKTRIAVAAAHRMTEVKRVHFASGPLLLARLGTGGFDHPVRQATMEALLGADALILDDLDKARPTEYAAEILFLAIDQRADGSAPLLITTNLSSKDLAQRWPGEYGEALASRLQLLDIVSVMGKDRRGRRR